MTTVILLESADAAAVTTPPGAEPGPRLEPRALTDGRFTLGAAVLGDPDHVQHHERLTALPTASLEEIAHLLPGEEEP